MTRHVTTVPPEYFDNLYALNPDPWSFETSDYERGKYEATLASLPRQTYASGLEVGCSIGVLTQRLAARCTRLIAVDVAQSALDAAQARCSGLEHVSFAKAALPLDGPPGPFDLVMLSEVIYFFSRSHMATFASYLRQVLEPGGDVVLVNWLGATHYPLGGDEAVGLVIEHGQGWLDIVHQTRTTQYRLDVLRARA